MKTTYYMNDTEIEYYVLRYKCLNDSEILLNSFEPYFKSFTMLFFSGKMDFSNKSQRIFVSKFLKENKHIKNKFSNSSKFAIENKEKSTFALMMIRRISGTLDSNELVNNMTVTLLTLAKRYRYVGKSFLAYLVTAFPHELYRQLKAYNFGLAFDQSSYFDAGYSIEPSTIPLEKDTKLLLNLDGDFELSHTEWLSGETASEPFKSMSRDERYVLSKYYEAKFFNRACSDREIGMQIGKNVRSINRIRNRVIKRLQKEWEKGDMKWLGMRKEL